MITAQCPGCRTPVSLKYEACPNCNQALVGGAATPAAEFTLRDTGITIKSQGFAPSANGPLLVVEGTLAAKHLFRNAVICRLNEITLIRFAAANPRRAMLTLANGRQYALSASQRDALPHFVQQVQLVAGRQVADEVPPTTSHNGKILVAAIVGVVALVVFALPSSPNPKQDKPTSHRVSQTQYGERWPFRNIPAGRVECKGSAAVFVAKHSGAKFALNGVAKTRFGYPFPHEHDLLRKVAVSPEHPDILINVDVTALQKLCTGVG